MGGDSALLLELGEYALGQLLAKLDSGEEIKQRIGEEEEEEEKEEGGEEEKEEEEDGEERQEEKDRIVRRKRPARKELERRDMAQ